LVAVIVVACSAAAVLVIVVGSVVYWYSHSEIRDRIERVPGWKNVDVAKTINLGDAHAPCYTVGADFDEGGRTYHFTAFCYPGRTVQVIMMDKEATAKAIRGDTPYLSMMFLMSTEQVSNRDGNMSDPRLSAFFEARAKELAGACFPSR
jgi:hypothetical protein